MGSANTYCPALSAEHIDVSTGYYTVPTGKSNPRVDQTKCEAGYQCANGVISGFVCGSNAKFASEGKELCSTVKVGWYSTPEGRLGETPTGESAHTGESVCPRGHWCAGGNKFKCPTGTYGSESGGDSGGHSGGPAR